MSDIFDTIDAEPKGDIFDTIDLEQRISPDDPRLAFTPEKADIAPEFLDPSYVGKKTREDAILNNPEFEPVLDSWDKAADAFRNAPEQPDAPDAGGYGTLTSRAVTSGLIKLPEVSARISASTKMDLPSEVARRYAHGLAADAQGEALKTLGWEEGKQPPKAGDLNLYDPNIQAALKTWHDIQTGKWIPEVPEEVKKLHGAPTSLDDYADKYVLSDEDRAREAKMIADPAWQEDRAGANKEMQFAQELTDDRQSLKEIMPVRKDVENSVTGQALSSLAEQAPLMAATVITGNPAFAAAGGFLQNNSDVRDTVVARLKAEGRLTPEEIERAGASTAFWTALAMQPFEQIEAMIPGSAAKSVKEIMKTTGVFTKEAGKAAAKQVLKGGAVEAVTEPLQTVAQGIGQNMATGIDQGPEQILSDAAKSAAPAFLAGGVIAGGGVAAEAMATHLENSGAPLAAEAVRKKAAEPAPEAGVETEVKPEATKETSAPEVVAEPVPEVQSEAANVQVPAEEDLPFQSPEQVSQSAEVANADIFDQIAPEPEVATETTPAAEPVTEPAPAIEPEAPAKAEPELKPRTFRKSYSPDDFASIETSPVASAIMENGGMLSMSAAKKAKRGNASLWDDRPKLSHPSHNKIYSPSGMMPDQLAQMLYDDGLLRSPDVSDLWAEIAKESKSARTQLKERKQQGILQKQAETFYDDAYTPGEGDEAINTKDLNVGDTVQIGTETMKVKAVDPDSFDVTLEDGSKFGVQKVSDGEIIYGQHEQQEEQGQGEDTSLKSEPSPLPTLRPMEKQGDLLSTQAEPEAFALSGETGVDHGAAQERKEQAERDREESEKSQTVLFDIGTDRVPLSRDAAILRSTPNADQRAAVELANKLGGNRFIPVGDLRVDTPEASRAKELAAAIGKRIVWFTAADLANSPNGFIVQNKPGLEDVIFINGNLRKPFAKVAAHEGAHHMETDAPKVYEELLNFLKSEAAPVKYLDFAKVMTDSGYDQDQVDHELVARTVGDVLHDPKSAAKVLGRNSTIFEKVLSWARGFAERIGNALLGNKTDDTKQVYKDWQVITKAVEKAMTEFAARKQRRASSSGNGNIRFAKPTLPLLPANLGQAPRDLSAWQRVLRLAHPGSWGLTGYLDEVVARAPSRTLAKPLATLARRIETFFDKQAVYSAKLTSPFAKWAQTVDSAERNKAEAEFSQFVAAANARDNGKKAADAWADAMALYPSMSPDGQYLVDTLQSHGQFMGNEMVAQNVHVRQSDGRWRPAQNLKEQFFPRMLADRTREIISDPDDAKNIAEYQQLLRDMVANGNAANEADAHDMIRKEAAGGVEGGEFFGSLDKARGMKLPDAYYESSLNSYLVFLNGWSQRMAQIFSFGQRINDAISPAFMEASNATNHDALKERIRAAYDEIYGEQKPNGLQKFINKYVVPIATVRYLTGVLTQTRNFVSSQSMTAENFGILNTLLADSKAVVDSAKAIGKMAYNAAKGEFRLIEPQLVSDAADIGTVQRSLYAAQMFDIDTPGLLTSYAMRPQQIVEMLNRGVNTAAAMTWLKDSQSMLKANPTGTRSLQRRAQMERFGFKDAALAKLIAGHTETVNRFLRKAVAEKQFSYNVTQTPSAFGNPLGRLFLQFQKWGVQRQRDLARNVFAPMFKGEVVDGKRIFNPAPFLRFILTTFGQTASVSWLAGVLFDRERKDPTIGEIMRTKDENESRAMQLAVSRILRDITMTGGMGLIGDYGRGLLDTVSPGRHKDLIAPPGIQLARDVADIVKSGMERKGDIEGILRDVKNVLILQTPLLKEAHDFGIEHLMSDDARAAKIKNGQDDYSMARTLVRRWLEELKIDAVSKGQFAKSPNSETFDQIQEALMIGDGEGARKIVDKFIADGGSMRSVRTSVSRRAPLIGSVHMGKDDEKPFLDWVKKRVPEQFSRIDQINDRYHATARAVGLEK